MSLGGFLFNLAPVLQNVPRFERPGVYLSLYTLAVVPIFVAAAWPQFRALRLGAATAWLALLWIANPFGHFGHTYFVWVMVAAIFAWPKVNRADQMDRALVLARAYCLSIYFAAGLWKLRALLFDQGPSLSRMLPSHFAHFIATGGSPPPGLCDLTISNPALSGGLWSVVIAGQLSSIFWLMNPKLDRWCGLFFISFHFAVGLTFGINYSGQVYLLAYLFLLNPRRT